MGMENARAVRIQSTKYRLTVREARTTAVRLATKLMNDALDSSEPVTKEAIQAMSEILKEAREVLGNAKKLSGNKAGIKAPSAEERAEAMKQLED